MVEKQTSDSMNIQCLHEEIEQLRKQIESYRWQDAKHKRIIMQLADVMFIVNKLGVVTDCSINYGTLTDLRKDKFIGLHIWDVFNGCNWRIHCTNSR